MNGPDTRAGGADVVVTGAELVATVDAESREIPGGWVAVTGGLVSGIGGRDDPPPTAAMSLDASGCLVTPGLINTHHHLYQNLTRAYRPAVNGSLFTWLTTLYPRWAGLDEEAAYLSAWVGLAELAFGGCTTSTDHLYVHPRGAGDLITAEITAAEELGKRTIEHFADVGWLSGRAWVAHCIYPDEAEVGRLGAAGVGVAHCPSSNMMIGGGGMAPVAELRAAGSPVGLGCDGSASTDHASLWLEARGALLLGRQRKGPTGMTARGALDIATRGSAACLGRAGELGTLTVGAAGDLVCWPLTGVAFAGALTDPVEAWLRCGPVTARHTVVAGEPIVRDQALVPKGLDDILGRHRRAAARMQGVAA